MVDFPSAVAIPRDYGPPAVDFSWLANLPNQFAQGQKNAFDQNQRQRTLALQQPISGDTQQVLQEVLKRGGAQYAEALLPFMLQQEQMKAASAPDPMLSGFGAQPQQQPAGNPPPASMTGGSPTNMKTPVTQQGGDAGGSITDIVTGQLGNTADAGRVLSRIALQMDVDPNAPLSKGQQIRVAGLLKKYAPDSAAPGQGGAPSAAQPAAAAPSPQAGTLADGIAKLKAAYAAQQAPQPQPQAALPAQAQPAQGVPASPQLQPAPAQPQPAAQGPIGPQVPLPQGFKPGQEPQAIMALRQHAMELASNPNPYIAKRAPFFEQWASDIEKSIQPMKITGTETLIDPRDRKVIFQGPLAAGFANSEGQETLNADAERYRQTGTLPPNMGRGQQGQQLAAAIRTRAAELEINAGGDPSNWPARWQDYKAQGAGKSQAERTKAVREENLKLILKAANAAIPAALEQSDKVWRSGFVPLNKIVQRGEIMTSDPELRAFGMANLQLAEHWARAMNPTGVMRESDRDLALQFLSTADSGPTYKRLVGQLKTQIEREYKSIQSGDEAFGSATEAMQDLTKPKGGEGQPDSAGWLTLPNGNRIRQVQ